MKKQLITLLVSLTVLLSGCEGEQPAEKIDIVITPMVGEEFASDCNYMTPQDYQSFDFNNANSWRFMFVSSFDGSKAQININGEIVPFILDSREEASSKLTKEVYQSKTGFEVALDKTVKSRGLESTTFDVALTASKDGSEMKIDLIGNCGV